MKFNGLKNGLKKLGSALAIAGIAAALSTSVCFAGELNLTDTYPKDGAKGAAIENFGIKLYFDQEMTAETVSALNEGKITITSEDGDSLPLKILYPAKEQGVVLVLYDTTSDSDVSVTSNTKYTVNVSADIQDDNGDTLGQDESFTFSTYNQTTANTANMVLMFAMFGGMMFFSTRSMKKAEEDKEKEEKDKKPETVNPYKEAKRTGKSVAEIVEKDQKEKAKAAAKAAEKAEKEKNMWIDEDHYQVKGPRPISAAGSTYKTGRKALAEAKAAEAAAKKEQQARWNAKKGKGKRKK